jgi:hypothetical protein
MAWKVGNVVVGPNWNAISNSIDSDFDTFASFTHNVTDVWSDYLTISYDEPCVISKVRLKEDSTGGPVDSVSIDAFYEGGWNNIFEGSGVIGIVEYPLVENKLVSDVRVKTKLNFEAPQDSRVYELQIWCTDEVYFVG